MGYFGSSTADLVLARYAPCHNLSRIYPQSMRTLVFLSVIGLVGAAAPSLEEQGKCLVDGAEAVNELANSAMFIWASIARCGHSGEKIKCEVNIASAIESVNAMINVILKAVDKCGDLNTHHKKCGLAASTLTRSVAGLSAAAGGIIQKCPNALAGKPHGNNWVHAKGALCVVNLKETANSLFKAIKSILKVKKTCDGDDQYECTENSLKVVASFAGLGEYLAGTLGHCTHTLNEDGTNCAQQVTMLIHHVTNVAQAGTRMAEDCHEHHAKPAPPPAPTPVTVEVQVPRLYEDEKKDVNDDHTPILSANMMLGAFLPITAIVSFVGGRFYANHRSRMEQTREFMSDNE